MTVTKAGKSLDLSDIISVAWRRKWLIILPFILVTAVAVVGSYQLTPEYQSSVIVGLSDQIMLSDQLRRLIGDARNGIGSQRYRHEQMRSLQNEIKSSPFLGQLLVRLKLDQDPELNREAGKIALTSPEMTLDQIRFEIFLNLIRDEIEVRSVGINQIRLSVNSSSPVMARDMAQNLAEILIEEKMKQALGTIRTSQEFTFEQLEKYEENYQTKINERTAFAKEYLKLQVDEVISSPDNRRSITSEIKGVRDIINDKETHAAQLLKQISEISANKITLDESNNLKRLKRDAGSIIESLNNLMLKYGWNTSEILNYKTQLYSYLGQIEDENKHLVQIQYESFEKGTRDKLILLFNARAHLDLLYSELNNLELGFAELENRVGIILEYQARLDQYDREVIAARELRDRFAEQQESSQISMALTKESGFRIIEPAKIPRQPFAPNRIKIIIMGIALGLMIGVGAVFLSEFFYKSFSTVDEVEEVLGIRVIGVIPKIEHLKKIGKK
jgi:uncharacterized protein involved in exopolysaccharide biosynthesis